MVTTDPGTAKQATKRRKTAHLRLVPPTNSERLALRKRCREVADQLDKSHPLRKDQMEATSRRILGELNLPEGFVGWTMVALSTEFWRDQVAAIAPTHRLLLLPSDVKHVDGCSAKTDANNLEYKTCVACRIADLRIIAEKLGYKIMLADGSPNLLKAIVSGHVDAIVAVAQLNVLEKAIDSILLAGIPCVAVPLVTSDGRVAAIDEDSVRELLQIPHAENKSVTRSFVHLLRGASRLFETNELERLAPRSRGKIRLAELNGEGILGVDPIAGTEAIAYDFLTRGGKHLRPFVTLAVYDALRAGKATGGDGARVIHEWPDAIKRAAMSIETFHKASLVHDDIEDEDQFRYGRPALHRTYGVPTAINVGDYLIGLGYRLVSRECSALGGECVAEILDVLADSHQRLSEGQGAELLWREAKDKRISPNDALRIYALKTAPAFEAAFLTGIRLAGPLDGFVEPIKRLSRDLGIAFQILNDLADWQGDNYNKMSQALDLIGGRPTVLLAIALQDLNDAGRRELERLVVDPSLARSNRVERAAQLYVEAGICEKAYRLIDKYQMRAEETAAQDQLGPLRDVLAYLIDLVLERHDDSPQTTPFVEPNSRSQGFPVTSP